MFPNFLCIGIQRAGTSWLYQKLKKHPGRWIEKYCAMRNFTVNQVMAHFKFEWAKFLSLFKFFSVSLLVILTFLFFDVETAFAHDPHDVISEVEISPSYDRDQTLFIALEGRRLLKLEDGGQTGKIIEKGLDNKYRLSSLDISSQFKKTLFLSSLGDGIYKSQDEGASWVKVNQGLGTLNIHLVSISPDSSDVVLAAGTEKGLYKTNNGGSSWHQVLKGDSQITAIAFSREQKDHIVIGDHQGILYESNDVGESWRHIFTLPDSGTIKAIAVSPNFSSDKTFFVGTEKGGIFKTVDGGISFKEVNDGLSDKSILSIAMSPNYRTDSTLFASTWQEGFFYSNDGGNTWNKSSRGLSKTSQADQFKKPHFSDLRISPTFSQDKTIFIAGFDGLFKSTDGGRIWREMPTLTYSSGFIKGIALSPDYRNDSTVAVSSLGNGAYISNDQGVTWTAINKGLPLRDSLLKLNLIGSLYTIFFSQNYRSDKTIFSGRWGYFFRSTDGGKHWEKNTLTKKIGFLKGNIGSDFRIAVASDNTIYLGIISGEILRSIDGGANFSFVGNVGQRIWKSLVISPNFSSDKTLYASVPGGVYKTVDGGYTWQPASKGIDVKVPASKGLGENLALIKLAISPSYQVDKTVFAGTAEGLFETKDGGENWRKLAGTAYGGDGYIEAIGISPNYESDRTFIVGVKGRGLFKTVNGGKTFTEISDSNMTNFLSHTGETIKFSPSYSIDRTIYVSSYKKLFKSTDGGNTWETLTIPKLNYNFLYLRLTLFPKHLYLRLTGSPKRRFLAASIAALLSYLLLGYLGLEKKLPFRKWQIRAGGAFATLIVVLILLSL